VNAESFPQVGGGCGGGECEPEHVCAEASARARYEGTLRRYQRRDDRTVRDSAMFSIVAEDWQSVRKALLARVSGPE